MTTPLFMLRCVQLGISIADLDLLTVGLVNDMFLRLPRPIWIDSKNSCQQIARNA